MTIIMVILALLLLCPYLPSVLAQTQAAQFLNKPKRHVPQHFYYDPSGILTMDGSVPGMSDPITLGTGPVSNDCSSKEFYQFTFCPLNKQAWKKSHEACPKGIYFCYESQLTEQNARRHFVLSKIPNEDFKKRCDRLSGFKVAMHHLPQTDSSANHDHLYLEVMTSFMADRYFFHVPKTNCLELWLGNQQNLMTSVRKSDKMMVSPIEVELDEGQRVGKSYSAIGDESTWEMMKKDFENISDFNNMRRLDEKRHLNLLFLDFRAEYPKLQQMFTVAPEDGKCNMIVRVKSNTGYKCKANFKQKNFALRAYTWGNTTYALTIESGFEQSQTMGSSTSQSSEQSTATETGKQTSDEMTRMSGLQNQHESVHEVRNEKSSSSSHQTDLGANANGDVTMAIGPAEAKIQSGAGASISFGTSEAFSEIHNRKTSSSSMDYNSQSTTSVLSNAYTHTSTISNIASTKTSSSQTVGINRRTVFKWTVTVPPGKILTPMQMQLSCEGKPVKIPWIKFLLKGEGDEQPVTEYD